MTTYSWGMYVVIHLFTLCYINNIFCKSIKNAFVDTESSTTEVCVSQECNVLANTIKGALNETEEPCNDFYNFACGGWKEAHKIPSSENEITSFTVLTKEIEDQLHRLLEEEPKPNENEALTKARSFYKSCMDNDTLESLGAKPALDFISYIGGWSLCNNDEWKKSSKKWSVYDVMIKTQRNFYPAPAFFTVEVTNDHMNSTKHLIKIDQSGLSLQREIYFNHSNILVDYGDYMVKVAKLLGYTCNEKDPENNVTAQMLSILEFEKKMAKLFTAAEAKQAGTFRRINLKILEQVVQHFPWKKHLRKIFPDSYKINEKEVILATSPVYLHNMADLIKKTDKRLLSRYVVWQMLRDKISFLSKDFRNARAEFNHKMTGIQDNEPRWRICTTVTNDNMGVPIGTLYVDKYFKESTKAKTKAIIEEIKKSFKIRIKDHDWIDNNTRKYAYEKVDALVAKVGYASYIKEPKELKKRFHRLSVDDDQFFANNLNVDKWIRYRLFNKLRKPVDKTKWPMFPQTINAMYQFYENEIVIPAGILQPPFFYTGDVPRSLSYGAIGSIIGHELTHGFDNTGRKFDKNGDIVKDWWSKTSLEEFMKRSKCFEDQYSKYKIQDKHPVSGKLTLGENIADNGGTQISFVAYKQFLMNNNDTILPNMEYTKEQLFFIGYAQEYCANIRPKTEIIATLSENHSPSKFRVIGTLSNSEEFAKAFRCREKSKEINNGKRFNMDPENKCVVW
ncbi:endothelin-converting enzyme homolog isoform X1 [Hydra vulgaris]|uniref:endothelin-converting enzyme homolog isoform X1 n=1 Tax=Hydra vulgaris TaxID=6087 RepID=UPI0002B49834|nr:endothelin-converting enzyme homolog [Hydra vulgaris]